MPLSYAQALNANKNKTTTTKKTTPVVQQANNHYASQVNKMTNYAANKNTSTPNYAAMNAANQQAKKYNDRLIVHYGGTPAKTTTVSRSSSNKSNTTVNNQPVAQAQQPVVQNNQQAQQNSWAEQNKKLQQMLATYRQNGLNAINSAYGNRLNALASQYGNGKNALASVYASQAEALRKSKEDAQRQAYIQSQEAERDMEQNLSAQGLSGGASESTLAKMKNNYANNRNQNEDDYLDSKAVIDTTYQQQLADIENQYQQLLNALESEKAQQISSLEGNIMGYDYGALSDAMDNQFNMDFAQYQNDLNMQAQQQLAALNQQYTLEQMDRELANKINYEQFKNSNTNNGMASLRAALRAKGYTEDEIASMLGA